MKKILGLVIIFCMVISMIPTVSAAVTSGTCGENLTWVLDNEGTLTISGTGAMRDGIPWYDESDAIKTVIIDSGVTTIGANVFYNCVNLTNVTIPDSVVSIGWEAFAFCRGLTNITIPDSVTLIDWRAFGDCNSLTSITIPDSVISVGYSAFRDCNSLSSITIPDSVVFIGEQAFYGTEYYNNSSNWENGVLYIGNHLIKAKTYINGNYKIRENIKSIADSAFYNCKNLNGVTMPDSIISVGNCAFYDCGSLININIPDSVAYIGENGFYDTEYYNNGSNWENNVLYIGNHLIGVKPSINGYYKIRENTKCIAALAFHNCNDLAGVTISDSVNFIGYNAFGCCNNLISITIPDSLVCISEYTFSYCRKLTSVVIPNSITSIKAGVFEGCTSLTDVYYTGTEEEWRKIEIDESNKELLDANIHFNINLNHPYQISSAPVNQLGSNIKKDSLKTLSTVSFSVENQINSGQTGMFLVAFYDENDKLIFAGKKEVVFDSKTKTVEIEITDDVSDAAKMKIFGLDGFGKLKPIMKTAEEIKFV